MKNVSEIFGFKSSFKEIVNNHYRTSYNCPFLGANVQCDPINKKSNLTDDDGNLLLSHQTGACSCFYKNNENGTYEPIIICPKRFEEKDANGLSIVQERIKDFFFDDLKKDEKLLFVAEVGLNSYGRADYMIARLKNNKIIDYAHCEFQADATTGTRGIVECVKDFYEGKDINKNYTYGLNTKATIKGFSLQMIDKGYLFSKLNKLSIWVMQDSLIDKFKSAYNLKLNEELNFNPESDARIYILGVKFNNNGSNKYNLTVPKIYSTTPENIQDSLSNREPISNNEVIKNIEKRLN